MEKEEAKKLKQKQRDRMSAKTGKMDIAYEVRPSGPLGGVGASCRSGLWWCGCAADDLLSRPAKMSQVDPP
jgi:hypothetical protein